MQMADTERNLYQLVDNFIKESVKKILTTNCEKTKFMFVNKSGNPRCELRIRDDRSNLGSILTEEGEMCNWNPNSIFDSSGISLTDFPPRTESLLTVMHIIPFLVTAIISKLDLHKACEFDGIPAIVIKKYTTAWHLLSLNTTLLKVLLCSFCF